MEFLAQLRISCSRFDSSCLFLSVSHSFLPPHLASGKPGRELERLFCESPWPGREHPEKQPHACWSRNIPDIGRLRPVTLTERARENCTAFKLSADAGCEGLGTGRCCPAGESQQRGRRKEGGRPQKSGLLRQPAGTPVIQASVRFDNHSGWELRRDIVPILQMTHGGSEKLQSLSGGTSLSV